MHTTTRLLQTGLLLLFLVPTAGAQTAATAPGGLSIDTLMATPFPTDLVAAPAAGRLAWVSSQSGVHNVLVADPAPGSAATRGMPDHKWRAVTSYTGDHGLWITELAWTSDAKMLVYVRGDGANRQGESPNPAQLQDGTDQAVFAVAVDGGAPRRLGAGSGPAVSPQGQRVAWVARGQIWGVDLSSSADQPAQLVNSRGSASGLVWSPDGTMLAFTSGRGTHSFIDVMGAGLYLKGRADVDPARIGLWGGSYGGYLTAMGLSRASDLFAAGVDFHGVHDWNQGIRTFVPDYNVLDDPDFSRRAFAASPMATVDGWKSPVLLIHGDDDRNVSFIESIDLIVALRKRNVEVEQLVFPDEVHNFLRHQNWVRGYQAAAEFFNRRLKKTATETPRH